MENIGQKVISTELLDVFSASEGSINLYYGMIGSGKTYSATADILELLKQGKVVYCNWHIKVPDFDDRENLLMIIMNILLFRKRFYRIPCKENLHHFDTEQFEDNVDLIEWLAGLNDCHIFFDEGQDMFDSYEGQKFSKLKRKLILHTRHYHRTLNIITQRPTAIQVSARGNVNRFYKCSKYNFLWFWPRFIREEFQEMKAETVDEDPEKVVSRKVYTPSRTVFEAYNTDYIAQGIPKSQEVHFEAFDLTLSQRLKLLLIKLFKKEKHG